MRSILHPAPWAIAGLGFALLAAGHAMGLLWAPPEAMMGNVGRILYAHVPTAWNALVLYLLAFVGAVGALWSGSKRSESFMVGAVEVGVLYTALLVVQGMLWARPTWGVYWVWDPRLTSTAVMGLAFCGVLLLRGLVPSPSRRASLSAVATVLSFASVPITYYSTTLWNSLHQPLSSPETVSSPMILPLRTAAFGMLFVGVGLVLVRARLERRRLEQEDAAPDLPRAAERVRLEVRP